MSKSIRFLWESQARAAWATLHEGQRDQVRRLLAAIRIAPGAFVRYDLRGRPLRIASAGMIVCIGRLPGPKMFG